MRSAQVVVVLLVMLALPAIGACSGVDVTTPTSPTPTSVSPPPASGPTPSPQTSNASAPSVLPSASSVPCPNPEGGKCLGRLAAGTYTTVVFQPRLTYQLSNGWANYEDTPGNFLLVPPSGDLAGVNAGTSDYIGVYTSVAPEALDCHSGPAQGSGSTPAAMASWLAKQPTLVTTTPKPAMVGGLTGVVVDIRYPKGSTLDACQIGNGVKDSTVIVGVAPSGLDHGVGPGMVMRLYLLASGGASLAVEIDDISGGMHLAEYSAFVKAFAFAP